MKKAIFLLSVAALSVKAAWGPLPLFAASSNAAPATTHTAQKAPTHRAAFKIHPKVQERLEEKKKEVPASVQKTIGTKTLQAIQTAARIQNFPLADLVTFWFLERTNRDGKNLFMFEDDTFCENFLKLQPHTIDRIGALYSKAKADQIRRILPKEMKPGNAPTLTGPLKAAILPFKNDACIAGCVVARSTKPLAERFAVQAQNVGAPAILCDPRLNFWLVHNWGVFLSQDIVEDWYKPIAQIVGRENLVRRGFPTDGSALSYRYNMGVYYAGIRQEVAAVLQANGYSPENGGSYRQGGNNLSRGRIDQRAMTRQAFRELRLSSLEGTRR